MKHPFFLNRWHTGEVVSLAEKPRHEHKQEAVGWFFYHERWLSPIAVWFKSNVQLRTLEDAVAATREAVSEEHQNTSFGGVALSVLTGAGNDKDD